MKKVVLGLAVMGLLVGGAFTGAQAQGRRPAFSLNLGAHTNLFSETSFDNFWFTMDARVGIPVSRLLEFSTEIMAMVDDSLNFSAVWLYPSAVLNVKLGDFFVGAGAVLPIVFYDEGADSGTLTPKINLGYRNRNLILTFYFLTSIEKYAGFLEYNYIGATVGYLF
jgi:hypothetical protein